MTVPSTRTHQRCESSSSRRRVTPLDGRVGAEPHFVSIVAGRLSQVTEQSSDAPLDDSLSSDGTVDPADVEQAQRHLDEARARVAEASAEVIVTNHVMGLYELAAIHLSSQPPDLHSASLAIDAVAALVDTLGERLGDEHQTLRDALANIQMVFVQIKQASA
jgi:hypothetical protein